MADTEISPQVTYEELAAIEMDFEDIDNQIMIKQYQLSKSAYARRSAAISKIPNFWPLVLEASPPELDSFVHPQDSKIFAESLTSIEITRPEIDSSASAPPKGELKGHPRSFQITFTFSPNAYFSNSTLTKTFHYRRASDGWCNLVSEPVRIDWKNPEQDLSEGLTDAAYALFHARKNATTTTTTTTTTAAGGDPTSLSMQQKSLPEYSHLLTLLTSKNGHNTSFFTWFGFVSSRRWVSAEESEKAWEEFYGKLEAVRKGETISVKKEDDDEDDADVKKEDEEEEEDDEEEYGDQAVEVFENGDDVAAVFAEEIWPNAIKYFTQAQEMDEDGLSFDDDESEDESEDGEEVDMQALVAEANNKTTEKKKKRQSDVGFPSKKQKN